MAWLSARYLVSADFRGGKRMGMKKRGKLVGFLFGDGPARYTIKQAMAA